MICLSLWYPSLAVFQFLLWTFIIAFAFLGIYLTRIFAGDVDTIPTISPSILQLMGISVGVPIISGSISTIKYATSKVQKVPVPLPPYSTMLEEEGKPSLTRFQMFAWTWIGISIYLFLLFSSVGLKLNDIGSLKLPDIDPNLVILMGLSQGAYVGGKIIAKQSIYIEKVILSQDKDGNNILSIFGNAFGTTKDTVWFDGVQIKDDGIPSWTDDRIDVKVQPVATAKHNIGVSRGSMLQQKVYLYEKEKGFTEVT